MQNNSPHIFKRMAPGYTVVEVMVILFIFTAMFMTMLTVFQTAIKQLNISRTKIMAVDVANEQMEIIRNLTYGNIGTVTGSPAGTLDATRTVTRSGLTFTVTTAIHYVDDPFDGCVGEPIAPHDPAEWSKCADGTYMDDALTGCAGNECEVNKPRDIPTYNNNPADYKKADVTVTWDQYYTNVPVKLSTIIAPRGLEGDTTKGFLLVTVFDSSGAALSGASVHVTNAATTPAYDKTFTTDAYGTVLLLDMDPADGYVIVVSKNGYSQDRTCSTDLGGAACNDAEGNPDPVKKHISISQGLLEEASFAIDQYSTLAVNSFSESCTPLPGIDFTIQGIKTISKAPSNILKTVIPFQTNGQGQWSKTDLEWDLYDLLVNSAGYDIAGINHDLALNILPNTNTTLNVLLAPHSSNALLITVKDNNGTSLSGATVRLTKTGYDETKLTGHGFIIQTDWSGGSGQADFTDATRYFSDDTHVDGATTSGQLTLRNNSASPFFTESFATSNYADTANVTADWNTTDGELKLATVAGAYPVGTVQYAQSETINAQHGKITSVTVTATEDLNGQTARYFVSADGGAHFESVNLGALHTFTDIGSDARFRIELETDDDADTPIIRDITLNYGIEYFDTGGELSSSTFNLSSAATFTTIQWEPLTQQAETGADSVRFQIATNTDNATWNFIGPDGTAATYYTASSTTIHDSHDSHQYLRYKLLLHTDDQYYSPQISDIRIGYTLACLPPGQAFFGSLDVDAYTAEVSLSGYQTETQTIDVDSYTTQQIILNPS